MHRRGPHAGDLPNLPIPESGTPDIEIRAHALSLGTIPEGARPHGNGSNLLDGNGSALVIDAAPDDYATAPAGHRGNRTACAVTR
jgi:Cu-Zn family superoxide dismutase